MRIVAWNILQGARKRATRVASAILAHRPDLVVLRRIRSAWLNGKDLRRLPLTRRKQRLQRLIPITTPSCPHLLGRAPRPRYAGGGSAARPGGDCGQAEGRSVRPGEHHLVQGQESGVHPGLKAAGSVQPAGLKTVFQMVESSTPTVYGRKGAAPFLTMPGSRVRVPPCPRKCRHLPCRVP